MGVAGARRHGLFRTQCSFLHEAGQTIGLVWGGGPPPSWADGSGRVPFSSVPTNGSKNSSSFWRVCLGSLGMALARGAIVGALAVHFGWGASLVRRVRSRKRRTVPSRGDSADESVTRAVHTL